MKPTITIGIPAYNESKNIANLLRSILRQQSNLYILKSIIVSSDGSTDDTPKVVKALASKKIKLIVNHDRQGIARGLNQIISQCSADILVTLDADITIRSEHFIEELVIPIIYGQADLTSSTIQNLEVSTPTAQALQIGMRVKQLLFGCLDNPNNIYHCYGLARAYSRHMYRDMIIPVSVGNDMYTYLYCLSRNCHFQYVASAIAWYKLPTNMQDHASQSHRFATSTLGMESFFGVNRVREELRIPLSKYIQAIILAIPIFLRHPLAVMYYLLIQLKVRLMPHQEVKEAWIIAESSK